MSESQIYCETHHHGPINKDSQQKTEHEETFDSECNWQKYDPKLHNPEYSQSILKKESKESEDDSTIAEKLYEFAKPQIKKLVTSHININDVYMQVQNNNHIETLNIDSSKAIHWLRYNYYEATQENYSDEQYKTALSLNKSQAIMSEANKEEIYNRIAMPDNNTIYYDLANKNWQAVKITKDEVKIIQLDEHCPIFTRKQHQKEQFMPIFDGKEDPLEELMDLLRIPQKDRLLSKVHSASFFLEACPIPIMVITGEHGSIKTTIAKSIKQIVDPSGEGISSLPKPDEIVLYFYNRYVANFDNISGFNGDISDILCRAITGEGQSKRALYTNSDEIIYSYRRKIILNGISPALEHTDLRDRCIIYETEPLAQHERITEEEYRKRFDDLVPHVLGQIFQTLSKALNYYDTVKEELKNLPRMADFTIFGECISRALGVDPFVFTTNYQEYIDFNAVDVLESYPIIQLIEEMMQNTNEYENNVSSFYREIKGRADSNDIDIQSKYINFPKAPNKVRSHIARLTPNLRSLGFSIQITSYNKRDGKHARGTHIIHIQKIDERNALDSPNVEKVSLSSLSPLSEKTQARITPQIDRDSDRHDRDNKEPVSPPKIPQISHEIASDSDDRHDRDSSSILGEMESKS